MKIITTLAAIGATCAMLASPVSATELLYTLESTVGLPSTDTGWDYIKMQPDSNRLFMARDKDGLTVFDVDAGKVIATVENSIGANGPLLLPEYDRGYVAMTDGSLLSFELSTLKPIARVPLSQSGGINSVVYDPSTRLIHAIEGTRPAKAAWYTLDPKTGKLVRTTEFPFRKMDDPAADGKGNLFAPARRDDIILKLDSKTLAEQARWPVGCNVSKVRYQPHTERILAACYGDNPQFVALDANTGKVVSRMPIGRGLDGLALDEKRHRIVTSNGADGTLTVIKQNGADDYEFLGQVSTRPGARMMTLDERTGRLLVIDADFTQGPPDADGEAPKTYHPDSFVVLTYKPVP